MQTKAALLPWALISALAAALLVFPLTKGRLGGTDLFELRLGKSLRAWVVTVLAGAAIALLLYDVVLYVYLAVIPQTVTTDCAGRAEAVTVTMNGPAIQILPLVEIVFAFWLLHIRALAVSPKTDAAK